MRRITDDEVWGTVSAFFEENGMARYQLESFNNFVQSRIHAIFETPRARYGETVSVLDVQEGRKRCVVQLENLTAMSPRIKEAERTKLLFPIECVWKHLTYASMLFVDVRVFTCEAGAAIEEPVVYHKVFIGQLPVPVRSVLCNVTALGADAKAVAAKGECVMDQGGYYVIEGQKKVLVCPERAGTNRVFVFANRKIKPRYSHFAEMKSPYPSGLRSSTVLVGVLAGRFPHVSCLLPKLETAVPLFLVFRALGVRGAREMAAMCLAGRGETDAVLAAAPGDELALLERSLELFCGVASADDALEEIGRRARSSGPAGDAADDAEADDADRDEGPAPPDEAADGADGAPEGADDPLGEGGEKEAEEDPGLSLRERLIRVAAALLDVDLFPAVGGRAEPAEARRKKALLLGAMVCKAVRTHLGKRPIDDRDHYATKRVVTPAGLLYGQFYASLKKMMGDLRAVVAKGLRQGVTINIPSYIRPATVTNMMASALSNNNWALKTFENLAIAHTYEQYNYMAGLANLRRPSIQTGKEGAKILAPRMLHGSHALVVCFSETPEGEKAGLVKNLAVSGVVSVGTDPEPVRAKIRRFDPWAVRLLDSWQRAAKVLLNGDWLGSTDRPAELAEHLRAERRRGVFPDMSVRYDRAEQEVRVSTEEGRFYRPVFPVRRVDGQPGVGLPAAFVDFCRLREKRPGAAFGLDGYRPPAFSDLVRKGLVEFLDKEEEEDCLLAGYPSEVVSDAFTHCELHPSLLFGVGATLVPYPDHNQSPRNCYQCLHEDTLVLMSDGSQVPIKDVRVGDSVKTVDPVGLEITDTKVTFHVVTETQKAMYRVVLTTGEWIIATADHRFLAFSPDVLRFRDGNAWVTPEELVPDMLMEHLWSLADSHAGKPLWLTRVDWGWPTVGPARVWYVRRYEEKVRIADITTESLNHTFVANGFVVHNSSMGKQAMGKPFMNTAVPQNGKWSQLVYVQKPLCLTRVARMLKYDQMPTGQNAIVAVMPFAFNQEDAVEFSKASLDRGFMRRMTYISYYAQADKGRFMIPDPAVCKNAYEGSLEWLEEDAVIEKGARVAKGDILIGYATKNTEDKPGQKKWVDRSVKYDKIYPGVVYEVQRGTSGKGYAFVRVVVLQMMAPMCHDKFNGGHAQKGTVGMVWNQEDMPFCPRLGLSPDVLINSLAFPSRMTIGMLIEMWVGKAVATSSVLGQTPLGAMFDRKLTGDATPFCKFDLDAVSREMVALGLHPYGDEAMYDGITGERLECLVFCCPAYYQSLSHTVDNKVHARARGGRVTLTRQPKSGRADQGGMRSGCMERDCYLAQGAAGFTKDRLLEQSDDYRVQVCDICGLFVDGDGSAPPAEEGEAEAPAPKAEAGMGWCNVCETSRTSQIRIPFSSKMVIQEMMAMGMVMRLMTSTPVSGTPARGRNGGHGAS